MISAAATVAASSSILFTLLFLPIVLASASRPPINATLLQDVVKAISSKQKWDWGSVSVSKLDLRRARYGTFQSYEFRIRVGKADLFFKFSDDVVGWKRFRNFEGDLGNLLKLIRSKAAVRPFKVEGPVELRVDDDHELMLSLPFNATHTGLRRIFIGEGITVEVDGAQEVFLFYEPELQSSENRTVTDKPKSISSPYLETFCMPLLPIHIIGPAYLIAYRTRNPRARIETRSLGKGALELLPEKCYDHNLHRKHSCPISSLNPRITTMEQVLRSLMGDGAARNGLPSGFVKAKIKASAYLRFQMQLERNSTATNGTQEVRLDRWKTRPAVEWVWFDVLAKLEGERIKPAMVKKVERFIAVDMVDLSSFLSNVSFTKLTPVLVPPEPLTLDVKW
ncbi:hypothetical protein SAY86_028223 [Trapa natans]|uniref:Uncharacterized protein n=1 Tax=Trapa natans TaxID=22666 RepID=A0AAN7M0P1_TRANT|nr:hypothetical protein SAY86_028223 [Trapa natans]